MKKLLLSVCLGSTLAFSTLAFSQMATERSVKELIVANGSLDMGQMMLDQILDQLRQTGATNDQINEIKKEFNADEFTNSLVPIYRKQFSEADVKNLLSFYRSPTGKKLVNKQPAIMQESMVVGQQWGMKVADKIQAISEK